MARTPLNDRNTATTWAGLVLIGCCRLAAADTVELSGGGHLSGKVTRLAEQKIVIVQVDDDIRVALPENRVRRVITSDRLAEYERFAAAAGDDAERHYKLARWCVGAKDFPGDANHYRQYHMQRAIELDPEHAEARASLDYIKEKGQWIRKDELFRRRGMVRSGGQWELPEVVAATGWQDAADETAKRWIKEITRRTAVITRGRGKTEEAWQSLAAIEDPLAADGVARQLLDSRGTQDQSRQLRMLWIDLLGRFRNGSAVKALVLAGIDEPDNVIREAALTKLQEYGSGSAVATYLPMLKSNDNAIVNRAARALSWFPDPELALTYVDALVTKHKHEVLPGAGTQAGFSDDGSGAFSTGGKKQVIVTTEKNPPVLGLLNLVEPDANYGYDEVAWREHFAAKLTAYEGDLRRDP
jgi:hypothetical protein